MTTPFHPKPDPLPQFEAGDRIEFDLMPGYPMTVLEVRACEEDAVRPGPHLAYRVIDPEGSPDWLCAHDVHKADEAR